MYKSKRFLAYAVSIVLFILMTYTTGHSPLELAGALSTLSGIYIIAQSVRKSDSNQ
jgi:hypothetical protein